MSCPLKCLFLEDNKLFFLKGFFIFHFTDENPFVLFRITAVVAEGAGAKAGGASGAPAGSPDMDDASSRRQATRVFKKSSPNGKVFAFFILYINSHLYLSYSSYTK